MKGINSNEINNPSGIDEPVFWSTYFFKALRAPKIFPQI
jgi:hypothetical protein